jgi:hypothetical protein
MVEMVWGRNEGIEHRDTEEKEKEKCQSMRREMRVGWNHIMSYYNT